MPFPPSLSASRLPDVDVDPLTLVHDPARLFLATFLRAILEIMMARRGCEPSTLGAVRLITWQISPPDHGAPPWTVSNFESFQTLDPSIKMYVIGFVALVKQNYLSLSLS